MEQKPTLKLLVVVTALLFAGVVFIDWNPWFGYTDSAILYLAVVVGAGFYWLGTILKDK